MVFHGAIVPRRPLRLEGQCVVCGATTNRANSEFCFICDDLKDICSACMAQHLTDTHTQIEFMRASAELLA
jgi:hypothetical protein